MTVMQ